MSFADYAALKAEIEAYKVRTQPLWQGATLREFFYYAVKSVCSFEHCPKLQRQ